MFNRLVAFDKKPRVRPLGIGEILWRLISKYVLRAVGKQAMAACGTANLSTGLPAGIEAAIHAVTTPVREERGDDPYVPATTPEHPDPSAPPSSAPAPPSPPAAPAPSPMVTWRARRKRLQ